MTVREWVRAVLRRAGRRTTTTTTTTGSSTTTSSSEQVVTEGADIVGEEAYPPMHAASMRAHLVAETEWLEARLRFLRAEALNLGLLRREDDRRDRN